MQPQGRTARRLERPERARARRIRDEMPFAEMRIKAAEDVQLYRRDARVVDERRGAERREARPERLAPHFGRDCRALAEIVERLDVDIQHVEEDPRRRAVGARMRRVVREERMQRVHADDAGAARAPLLDQRSQIGEIADPPVALGSHRVELHRRPPRPAVAVERRGAIAARRCDDEQALVQRGAGVDQLEAVVTAAESALRREFGRQGQRPLAAGGAVDVDEGGDGQVARRELAGMRVAAFRADPPGEPRGIERGREPDPHRPGRSRLGQHHHRRERAAPLDRVARGRIGRAAGRGDVDPERAQEGAQARFRGRTALAPDVFVLGGDAVQPA